MTGHLLSMCAVAPTAPDDAAWRAVCWRLVSMLSHSCLLDRALAQHPLFSTATMHRRMPRLSESISCAKALACLLFVTVLLLAVARLAAAESEKARSAGPVHGRTETEQAPSPCTTAPTSKSDDAARRRTRELIYVLRQYRVFDRCDEWGAAIRELIQIGKPAIPELVAELDRTDREQELRALGFILRAIHDPRAVPALIRAIPKTLQPPRSDYGLSFSDAELNAFMREHQRYKDDKSQHVSYGRPVNEILDALAKISGHHEPANEQQDPLRHIFLADDEGKQAAQRQLFDDRRDHWQQWWIEHHAEFATDEELHCVDLPAPTEDLVEQAGVAKFGPLFPTGDGVRLGPVQRIKLERLHYWNGAWHIDFDAGHVYQYMEGNDGTQVRLDKVGDAIRGWYKVTGVDARNNGSPEGIDLHVWLIDDDRWDTLEDEIHRGGTLSLGRETTDFLVPFEASSTDFKYDRLGTFLFTTREGGRGILQILPRRNKAGPFHMRYRMWIDAAPPVADPTAESKRVVRAVAGSGRTETFTLEAPGRRKKFLFKLAPGEAVAGPDDVVPENVQDSAPFGHDSALEKWCRDQGVDLAAVIIRQAGVAGAPKKGGDQTPALQLLGLDLATCKILPDSFGEVGIAQAEEILSRFPNSTKITGLDGSTSAEGPATFVIRARDGSIAVLQIVATDKELRSVTLACRKLRDAMSQ